MSEPSPAGATVARRSLRHDVVMMLVGRIAYLACQGGSLVALARLGDNTDVGMYSLGLAVSAPILQFFSFNLRAVQATDAREEFGFATYSRLRNWTAAAALVVGIAFAAAAGYAGEVFATVVVLTGAKVVESQSDLIFGLWQRKNRFGWLARSMVLKGGAMLVGVTGGFLVTDSVVGAAAGTLAGWSLVFALHDQPLARRLVPAGESPDNAAAWALVRRALPMAYVLMLTALAPNLPRYFLEHFHGASLLGYFSAADYVVVASTALVTTFGNSVLPRLADRFHLQQSSDKFTRLLVQTLVVTGVAGTLTALGAAAFGDHVLSLLFGPDYADYRWLLVGQAVVALLFGEATLVGGGLVAARRFKELMLPSTLAVAANAATCFVLVPDHGVYGAMAGGLVSMSTLLVGRSLALRKVLAERSALPAPSPADLPGA